MAYKVTHIKTKGDDSFEFYDKGAIRGIKPSFTEESGTDSNGYYIKDDNGYITIKKITYSAATEDALGLISVPSSIEKDGKKYTNDLILESGKLSFKDKIKNAIDCLRQINLDNIDTIIIDLRGNFGGNASLNKYLMDFLKENADKQLGDKSKGSKGPEFNFGFSSIRPTK